MSGRAGAALDRHKLAAARLAASARLPYLASALFASPVAAAADSRTIAIDARWQIHADPACVERLDVDQLARLLVHLAGHVLRDHAGRADRTGIDADESSARWNRAADAEINDDLAQDDLVPGVAPDTPDALGCDPGGLVEAYYTAALDGERHWDCGSGCDNRPRPWDGTAGIGAAPGELLRLSVAADIGRHHAQQPGTVAAGWLRWAEAVLPSRTDWRRALAAEVRHGVASVAGSADYSYRRPSRRQGSAPGVILPSLRRPVPEVAIVCDTSGSMDEQLLARAVAEVDGILRRVGVRQGQVRVLAVDADVNAVRRVTRAAQVQLAGGGGTDMGQGVAAAADLRPRPAVVVVLTDGFTPWPRWPPRDVRVVVGLLTEGIGRPVPAPPDWARTIRIDPTSTPVRR